MANTQVPYNCTVCGEKESSLYLPPIGLSMAKHKICFSCAYWQERVYRKHMFIIIEGECYVEGNLGTSSFQGFGGARFIYQTLHDNALHTTHNLWSNGPVPDHFRDQLPDTARWVSAWGKEYPKEVTE